MGRQAVARRLNRRGPVLLGKNRASSGAGGVLVTARAAAVGTGGRAAQAAVGHGPLHVGADEHRGVVDALAAAALAAAAVRVDLVAVVLVVGHPVNVVEGAVVVLQRVVVVVPELLQP